MHKFLSSLFLSLCAIVSGCAGDPRLPDAQRRALNDYRSAQEFCIRGALKKMDVISQYVTCMSGLGYIEPYPVPCEGKDR